jgi:hypothetical protein
MSRILVYNWWSIQPGQDMSEIIEQEEPAAAPVAVEVHSVAARAPIRTRLAADVEAFLARGGKIAKVPKDLRADPPRRQESTYGRGAI